MAPQSGTRLASTPARKPLQLMAMQPDKVPQKNDSVRVDIEMDPEAAEALEFLEQFSEEPLI